MLKEIIDLHRLKTHEIGLLQTKAFRMLKERTGAVLKPYDITSTEWAFLGTLDTYPKGIKAVDLAGILDVEAPFVTALFNKFKKKKWVTSTKDPEDARAKCLMLTKEGGELVHTIEPILREASKRWLKDVSISEVVAYVRVLKKLTSK